MNNHVTKAQFFVGILYLGYMVNPPLERGFWDFILGLAFLLMFAYRSLPNKD